MRNSTTRSLYDAIKDNDEEALKGFYSDNFSKAESYILKNRGSREDAKDIYQEAFLAVWRNVQLDKFILQDENSLAAYLYRIVKNKWTDHLRTMYFKKTTDLNDEVHNYYGEEPEEPDIIFINLVRKKYNELGKPCKELLNLFYFKKETIRKIAGRFNWTEATAKNNKYRCMEKLRDLLKNEKL